MFRQGIYSHHVPAQDGIATANSAGVGSCSFGPVPEGVCWYVERISTNGPTAGTVLEVFVQQTMPGSGQQVSQDEGTRADYTPTGNNDILDEVNPIFVPAGYYLNLRWNSAASGDQLNAAVQYSVHQLDARDYQMNPGDRAQIGNYYREPPVDGLPVLPDTPYPKAV